MIVIPEEEKGYVVCVYCGNMFKPWRPSRIKTSRYCSKKCQYSPRPFENRFWSYVNKERHCWDWKGALFKNGYGKCFAVINNKKIRHAHRVSWIIHFGKIPNGMGVLHKCDNKKCVNPNHLFLGTQKDNNRDAFNKGRNIHGEKVPSSKLKEEDVRYIRYVYSLGNISFESIAKTYNVSASTIRNVVRGITWKRVK